jgi:hypothetical protein
MRRMILAVVVGFVVQLAGLFLIHSVLLRQDYVDTAAVWRPREAQVMRVWAMLLAVLIYVVGAVLIYLRGVEQKPWMGRHSLWNSVGLGGRRIRFAERVGHLADTAHVGSEVDCQREFAVRGVWLSGGGNLQALGRYHRSSIV